MQTCQKTKAQGPCMEPSVSRSAECVGAKLSSWRTFTVSFSPGEICIPRIAVVRVAWIVTCCMDNYLDASSKHISIPQEPITCLVTQGQRGGLSSHAEESAQELQLEPTISHWNTHLMQTVWTTPLETSKHTLL